MSANGYHTNGLVESTNISKRASFLLDKEEEFLCKNLVICQEKPWSPDQTDGYVNLGTAESSLGEEILVDKVSYPITVSKDEQLTLQINNDNLLKIEPHMLRYYKFCGISSCRQSMAKFIERYFKSSIEIDPEKLIILSGTTSILDALAHIIADPGDFFMCTTPFYSRISDDLMERSLVDTIHVPLEIDETSTTGYTARINVQWIEDSYNKGIAEGKSIRALVIVNPNNPLGIVHSKREILSVLEFCSKKKLYLIFDEIYALSVYKNDQDKFYSILSLMDALPQKDNIIWIWGLSKDFCGAGLRTSIFYTQNRHILKAGKILSFFQCLPSVIQHMTARLLSDYDWLDKVYFPHNNQVLKRNCEIVEAWLHRLKIPHFKPNAGLFIFVNFSQFLENKTQCCEMKLFEKFMREKVYIIPGGILYAHEPGWYRIVFAQDRQSIEEGLRRIATVLLSEKLRIHLHIDKSKNSIIDVSIDEEHVMKISNGCM